MDARCMVSKNAENERRCGKYLHTVWDLKNAFDDEPAVMGWNERNCDSDMPLHFALAELAYSMR